MISCARVQVFLLALLAWVLPAFVLLRLERQVGCHDVLLVLKQRCMHRH